MELTAKSQHRRGAIDFHVDFLKRKAFVRRVFRAMEFEEDFRINTREEGVIRVFGHCPDFETHFPGEPTPVYEITVKGKGTRVDAVVVKSAKVEVEG